MREDLPSADLSLGLVLPLALPSLGFSSLGLSFSRPLSLPLSEPSGSLSLSLDPRSLLRPSFLSFLLLDPLPSGSDDPFEGEATDEDAERFLSFLLEVEGAGEAPPVSPDGCGGGGSGGEVAPSFASLDDEAGAGFFASDSFLSLGCGDVAADDLDKTALEAGALEFGDLAKDALEPLSASPEVELLCLPACPNLLVDLLAVDLDTVDAFFLSCATWDLAAAVFFFSCGSWVMSLARFSI